ncbi:MAG: multiheme c-type cytochrome [Pirellulales bacterium]
MKTQSGRSRVVIASAVCLTGVLLASWPALRPTPEVRLEAQESRPRVAAPAQPADKLPADKLPANSNSRPKPTELASVRLPLFEGWEKPDVALVLTGRLAGYIEPCGCAGLANQKGGLTRRFTLLNDLRKQGWTLVPLDVGDQIKRFGRQSEIKFQMTFEGLKLMDYQAIGLGPHDLRLSSGELFAAISDQPARFVCANAAVLDRELLPRSVAIEANGWKIGVTAVLGDEYRRDIRVDEVTHEPAADGLRLAWAQLEREKCDLHVMLVYGSLAETHRLARQFPQFQLVVTTGGGEEPPLAPEPVPNTSTPVIQVGGKGMYVGVLGLYRSGDETVRYQRVPLDDRFADTPAMLELLSAYQDQLQAAGLEGLGVKPQAHPSGRSFVGTAACGNCHTQALAAFEKTSHAHALDTLIHPRERSAISRQHDPECLSCHVTGWNPQLQLPFKTGYLSLESTAERVHVGCENCHGPGSAHVAAEENEQTTAAARDKLRQEMRLPLAKARNKCVECHDLDNSPAFQLEGAFERYWKKVEHVGKD